MAKTKSTENVRKGTEKATAGTALGLGVHMPSETCTDVNCPFHGTLPVRGRVFDGKVVSTRAQRTAIIEREYPKLLTKFERYERRHSRISAHRPDCITVKEGDLVRIAECRPLSKTKHFVVVEVTK
jgi:small subunit ribosomal protein S17